MTTYGQLNDIALALLQVTALLLPVVFLSMNFAKNEGLDSYSERIQGKIARVFIYMIVCLTGTGFLATFGLLETSIKRFLLFASVVLLSVFFAFYGHFIYLLVKGAE